MTKVCLISMPQSKLFLIFQRKRKLDSLKEETAELKKKIENNEDVLTEVNKGKEDSVRFCYHIYSI